MIKVTKKFKEIQEQFPNLKSRRTDHVSGWIYAGIHRRCNLCQTTSKGDEQWTY